MRPSRAKGRGIDQPPDLSGIAPDLIARFGEALDRLWPPAQRTGPLGLAVSGGPDSMALLLLAHAHLPPGSIAVASVDHGLRAEAAAEVALVEGVCRALDVPFRAIRVSVPGGNMQAMARAARYRELGRWARETGCGAIATAHHADDQAETLLMRLARGSGLSGLAGVRAYGDIPRSEGDPIDPADLPPALIRPLLWARKHELESVCAAAGIAPVRDPSNEDPGFDRVRVRAHLAAHNWLDPVALADSAQHLADAWRAIEWYAQIDWEEMVAREEQDGPNGPVWRYYANVPRVIQIETLRRIVRELGGQVTRGEAGRAADRLWACQNASLGGVLAVASVEKIAKIGVDMRVWRFTPEPPRRMH